MNTWITTTLQPTQAIGKGTSERNFASEDKNFCEIFVREAFQNTLDARLDESKPVEVTINLLREGDPTTKYLKLAFEDLAEHLDASGVVTRQEMDSLVPTALVYEEFNTTGLTGTTNKSHIRGVDERWANFWHGEGKRSKSGTSRGRAGEGKITYHQASTLRALFALSKRNKDTKSYLYGKCIFKEDYSYNGETYGRHAHWCKLEGGEVKQPIPTSDLNEIKNFIDAFSLTRKDYDSGTSFVIPYPLKTLGKEEIIRAIISEFFFTILSGHLKAKVCGTVINSDTISDLLYKDSKPSKIFFDFVKIVTSYGDGQDAVIKDDWHKLNAITDEQFYKEDLELIKTKFNEGTIVGVKFPLVVTPKHGKKKTSYIKVYLQSNNDDIEVTEEIFTRSGLTIGKEEVLKGCPGKIHGLCIADDEPISDFLGHAEEASHMKWNARDEEVNARYVNVAETLRCVRQAPARLYRFLKGLNQGIQEDKFLDILSIPGSKKRLKKRRKVEPGGGKPPKEPPPIPPKKPELLSVLDNKPGAILIQKGDIATMRLPLEVKIQMAYARMKADGNAFSKYHHLDFDLSDSNIKFKPKNVEIISKDLNETCIKILAEDFSLEVSGFSKHQRMTIRLDPTQTLHE